MGRELKARNALPGGLPELLAPDLAAAVLEHLLEELDRTVLVLDGRGHLVLANEAGAALLARGDLLVLDGGSVLPAPAAEHFRWQRALRHCLRGERQFLVLDGGTDVVLSRLGNCRDGKWQNLVLVMLGQTPDWAPGALADLAGAHRLTGAESRVLAGIARGLDTREIARVHGVTEATVRTQIKSLLAKTGTGSVRGLLLRLARLPPVPAPGTRLTPPADA